MIKQAQAGAKGGMASAASAGATSATGAQVAEGLLAIGQGAGLITVAPVAAAIGGDVAKALDWLFN